MKMNSKAMEDVIFFYMLMKQRKYIMDFYDEKIEYIEHKIKFSRMLQRKL